MAPFTQLARRANSGPAISPVYIVGFVVIGLIVLGLAGMVAYRFYKKSQRGEKIANRGAAFLSVRGLVKEEEKVEGEDEEAPPPPKKELPDDLQIPEQKLFSRKQINSQIILPAKALNHPTSATNDDIIEFYRSSGIFPRPFTPSMGPVHKPFSFALNAHGEGRLSILVPSVPSSVTGSQANTPISPMSETMPSPTSPSFRVPDGAFLAPPSPTYGNARMSMQSSRSSIISFTSKQGADTRKVHQLFMPVLPDELLLARTGERLTIIQSFDDGWCCVGRENPLYKATKSPFSSKDTSGQDGMELGVVPAWIFIKPVKGLRAERPVRVSSLGITVEIQRPGYSSRDEVISWSNF